MTPWFAAIRQHRGGVRHLRLVLDVGAANCFDDRDVEVGLMHATNTTNAAVALRLALPKVLSAANIRLVWNLDESTLVAADSIAAGQSRGHRTYVSMSSTRATVSLMATSIHGLSPACFCIVRANQL
ncbi:hypothetical protein [Williamsia sp. D3]|uniref:hypothetical protein n=1 Tax=Williamsia sp. D3 TaxID=1313067 RepID=UPI001268D736|nr:hypothetical protein [Williamsia sp. D3]